MLKKFKEFLGIKSYEKHPSGAPKINEPGDIKEYPDEAQRQHMLFYDNIHRKDWADTDFQGEEPEQDTIARDKFHKKYNLRKLPTTASTDAPHEVARHLDHYHHFYPDIAKRFNMQPMTAENSEKIMAASEVHAKIFKAKLKVKKLFKPKEEEDEPLQFKQDRNGEVYVKPNRTLMDIFKKVDDMNRKEVKKYHGENKDFHHLEGSQVYGHYRNDISNNPPHDMHQPMPKKDFENHWNKINGKK